MKLIDKIPFLNSFSDEEILQTIPQAVLTTLGQIAQNLDQSLSMIQVLRDFARLPIIGDPDQLQISCPFPEHGSEDKHRSARYYRIDRKSGIKHEAVHCFKCSKTSTPFWIIHNIEKNIRGKHTIDIMRLILNQYRLVLPRDIISNHDPEAPVQSSVIQNLAAIKASLS